LRVLSKRFGVTMSVIESIGPQAIPELKKQVEKILAEAKL